MRKLLIDTMTTIAALCALFLTVLAARREFRKPSGTASGVGRDPVMIAVWDSVRSAGHHFGSRSAPVTVVEFGDFECPACRRFAPVMKAILTAYPRDVQFVYRHLPLSYHRFAYPAARAFECGAEQSIAEPLYHLLYEKQDSLGLIPFTELAKRAGVRDTVAFASCAAATAPVPAIATDTKLAETLAFNGTPAIVVNGLYINTVPDSTLLDRFVQDALKNGHVPGSR